MAPSTAARPPLPMPSLSTATIRPPPSAKVSKASPHSFSLEQFSWAEPMFSL